MLFRFLNNTYIPFIIIVRFSGHPGIPVGCFTPAIYHAYNLRTIPPSMLL